MTVFLKNEPEGQRHVLKMSMSSEIYSFFIVLLCFDRKNKKVVSDTPLLANLQNCMAGILSSCQEFGCYN